MGCHVMEDFGAEHLESKRVEQAFWTIQVEQSVRCSRVLFKYIDVLFLNGF